MMGVLPISGCVVRVSSARNHTTEAVRITLPVVDIIRKAAKNDGITFQEAASRIVRQWAEHTLPPL